MSEAHLITLRAAEIIDLSRQCCSSSHGEQHRPGCTVGAALATEAVKPPGEWRNLRDKALATGVWRVRIGEDRGVEFRINEPGDPVPEAGATWGLPG